MSLLLEFKLQGQEESLSDVVTTVLNIGYVLRFRVHFRPAAWVDFLLCDLGGSCLTTLSLIFLLSTMGITVVPPVLGDSAD